MVFLIGGPSHVGKTTLARALADQLGWARQSTDHLGRHPGRPWGGVRAQVADHYLALTTAELMAAYEAHYARMWPLLERLITHHATDASAESLVLEGSGIRPAAVAGLHLDGVEAVWLTASDETLRTRIHAASGYAAAARAQRVLIDRFVDRTLADCRVTRAAVERLGLSAEETTATTRVGALVHACRERIG